MNKKIISVLIILAIFCGIAFGIYNKNNSQSKKEENIVNNLENDVSNDTTNIVENTAVEVEEEQNTELFSEFYDKSEEILNNMTIEEKVGQMFLVRFPETGVISQIENYNPGGYILFGRDFKNQTKTSILEKLNQCQNSSKIKLILGVDEEGGTVTRVSSYSNFRSSKFEAPQSLWSEGGLQRILEDSTEKSSLLKSIGLNMNLAPVADIPTNSSSFIYKRSYGKGPEETAEYVSELIKTMNNDNMISVIKHFPGYGDNVDTHTGIAIDERGYEVFENSDFLPFKSGIESGAPCILVNHNIVNSMDSENPASLSKNVHDILRNELNFSGVIMTDDLAMDAVKKYAENGQAAVKAVLAGNDLIITSDFVNQKREVLDAVNEGKISEEQINKSVIRILALKFKYGIL